MQPPEISELVKAFAQNFSAALGKALSDACASSWQVTLADQSSASLPDEIRSFRYSFEGTRTGDVVLAFPASSLATLSLRDVPADATDVAEAQTGILLSGLREGLPSLSASVDKGGTSSIQIEAVAEFVLADEQVVELWLQSDPENTETRLSLHLCLSQKLLTSLQAASAKPFEFPDAANLEGSNLDLVMDVELNVMLRFGQRQLALREVLELTSGSVVELDRQVDEPVELVLDGRVVARGEAVIIDGNYGMRITQLIQHALP